MFSHNEPDAICHFFKENRAMPVPKWYPLIGIIGIQLQT